MSVQVGVTTAALFEAPLETAIERAAAAGADAVEFYDWESVDIPAIRETAAAHDVEIGGTLAAGAGSNIGDPDGEAISDPADHEAAVSDIERSIVAAAELGARSLIVTVGQRIDTLDRVTQQNAIVRVLRSVAPTAAEHGVTIVLEPLNTRVDHPGYFLRTTDRGVAIVEAVDSPHVRLLYDVYHQQITEGNVIQTMTTHLDAIGHIHIADVPGRHEPGTGELNYERIFEALVDAGYDGIVACEFSPTGSPDDAIAAVRKLAETAE